MYTDDNSQYLSIKEALQNFLKSPSLEAAPKLAETLNPLLYQMSESFGSGSKPVEEAATEIGKCLLSTVVRTVNETCHNLTPLGSQKYLRTLKNAGEVMNYISQLPLESDFRENIFSPQYSKLQKLTETVRTFSDGKGRKTISWNPDKKSNSEGKGLGYEGDQKLSSRKGRIQMYIAIVVALGLAIYIFDIVKERTEFHKIADNYTEEAITAYLSDHGNTHYRDEALALYLAQMDSILLNPTLLSQPTQFPPLTRMDNLARSGLLPDKVREAVIDRVKTRTDSLYAIAKASGDLKGWYHFQAQAPSTLYYDSSEQIDSLEQVAWSAEPTAWEAACSADNRSAYQRYLEEYPAGAHAKQADGRLVDMEVNDYRNRGKSTTNKIERVGRNSSDGSTVNIFNDSDYELELLFSGPDSQRMRIQPKNVGSLSIADGEYKILIKASGNRNAKFSFSQTFDHGVYSSVFSINN